MTRKPFCQASSPLRLLFVFLSLLSGCVSTEEPASSPNAEVGTPLLGAPPRLVEAERLFQDKKYKEVSQLLDSFRASSQAEEIWQRYFLGQAQMELGSLERGLKLLESNYLLLRDQSEQLANEERRIAARSLKRIGWYYRQKKEFEKAYAYHHLQYLYLKELSTPAELHDVLLSLDVDSYELRQSFASEHWLRESLEVAEKINEPLARARALAMSLNNLADTLRIQKRWTDSLEAIGKSREQWHSYDGQLPGEHRELWAVVQTAEIYGAWAKFLRKTAETEKEKDNDDEVKEKFDKAREEASEALRMAENLKLDAAEQADLENRVRAFGLKVSRAKASKGKTQK